MSIGRPRKTIKTRRIQAVLPEEILKKLDKKVFSEKNLDRSKALTEAVNEWLGLTKRKRSFENIYKKFFGYNNTTMFDELSSFVMVGNNQEEKKILELIKERLFEDRTLLTKEVEEINNYISKHKFFVDKKLRLHCSSDKLFEILGKLFLNTHYPINNYIGHCGFCGKEFFKKKVSQKYDTPICKIHNLEKKKSETTNPKIAVELKKNIDKIKQNLKLDINEYFDINNENKFENIKKYIEDLCYKANYKYSIFKKNFKKLLNDKFELEGFGNCYDIYSSHIVQSYDLETINKLFFENFGDFFAQDVFPDKNNIRYYVSQDIKNIIDKKMFDIFKMMAVLSKTISELPNDVKNIALSELSNKLPLLLDVVSAETSQVLNNTKLKELPDIFKNNIINSLNLRKAYLLKTNHNPEASIEICEKILKENKNNLDALNVLIDTYFSMGPSKYKEIISCYEKIEEISEKMKKIQSSKDITVEELSSYMTIIPGMPFPCLDFINPRHIEVITAFASAIEGKYEESLILLSGEVIEELRKYKEKCNDLPDSDLYYPKEDKNFVILARVISNLALSKDERMIKKANELKVAFLNNNYEELEKVIIAFEKSPEITRNIATE